MISWEDIAAYGDIERIRVASHVTIGHRAVDVKVTLRYQGSSLFRYRPILSEDRERTHLESVHSRVNATRGGIRLHQCLFFGHYQMSTVLSLQRVQIMSLDETSTWINRAVSTEAARVGIEGIPTIQANKRNEQNDYIEHGDSMHPWKSMRIHQNLRNLRNLRNQKRNRAMRATSPLGVAIRIARLQDLS